MAFSFLSQAQIETPSSAPDGIPTVELESSSTSTNSATFTEAQDLFDLPKPIEDDSLCKWGINPITYEVEGSPEEASRLVELNTPALIEERYRACLVLLSPDEYFRRFPKSSAQIEAEQKAFLDLLHPQTIDEVRAGLTSARRAEFDAAILAIEKPQYPDTNSIAPPPGVVLTYELPDAASSSAPENESPSSN